ncbi:MAG: hypothetical protein ACKOXK_04365 [Chakrabartia sp.]
MLSTSLLILLLYGSPDAIVRNANGDTLVPLQMAVAVHSDPHAWATFQWSRVASLPDFAWFWIAEGLGLGWRTALLVYTCLVAAALTFCLAFVAARLAAQPVRAMMTKAAGALLMLLLPLTALHLGLGLQLRGFLQFFYPESHGNALLLALIATGLPKERRFLLLLVCVIGTISDFLFVTSFVLPLLLAMILTGRRSQADLRHLLIAMAGYAIGGLVRGQMFMQTVFTVPLLDRLKQAPDILLAMSKGEMPWLIGIGMALMLIAAFRAHRQAPHDVRSFLLLQASLAALGGLGLAFLALLDEAGWRYAMPSLWWPVAVIVPHLPAPRRWAGTLALAISALLLPYTSQALRTWRSSTEACVAQVPGLQSGLATYWFSRQTEASANWQRHIATIDAQGAPYILANDVASYWRDGGNPHRPARFNFIIVDKGADPAALRARYGAPARRIACPKVDLWVYDEWLWPMSAAERQEWLERVKGIEPSS